MDGPERKTYWAIELSVAERREFRKQKTRVRLAENGALQLAAPGLHRTSSHPLDRWPFPFARRICAGGCYRTPDVVSGSPRYRSEPNPALQLQAASDADLLRDRRIIFQVDLQDLLAIGDLFARGVIGRSGMQTLNAPAVGSADL